MATAMITGASKGLGEEFAWQLATSGHDVVLTARSQDRLADVAELISSATGVGVETIVADLADPADVETLAARLSDDAHPISLLVNNAGYGIGTGILRSTWEQEQAMLDVLVRAPLRLSQAAVQAMVPRGRGAVLNVASVAAHLANTTYAAHKRWLLDFTQALAGQLRGTGVTATAVIPGLVRTEFHDAPELAPMREQYPDLAWLSAEQVVSAALAGVRRKQVVVTPSLRYSAAVGALRLVPTAWTRGARSVRAAE